jgi:hypothetical protein
MTTTSLTTLDEQIAAAQAELDAAQNRWRTRPRGAPRMGGGNAPIQIDPAARADMLDRGLAVDDAAIHLEQLKKQRAEAALAELLDPDAIAAEDAAVEAAADVLREAEAAATAARVSYQAARGAQKSRTASIKSQHQEIARPEGAIRSTEALRVKEQAQRDELAPLIPSPTSARVVARAS